MQLTLKQVAELTGGTILRGDACAHFAGVASLVDAGSDEISFLGNERYFSDFLSTAAGVVIVPPNLPKLPVCDKVALVEVSGNPSVSFNAVVKHFLSSSRKTVYGIHPTAVVSESAQLDRRKVSVGPHVVIEDHAVIGNYSELRAGVYIGEGVVLGEHCLLHPHVVIRERCRLGNRVVIQPNATIGSDGFGYQLVNGRFVCIEQAGIVELEDDVEIGANSTVDRARFGKTKIGKDTKIDNLVQIGHNCVIGNHTIIVAQSGVAGSTTVGNYVTVAAQCGIAGHLHIGDYATLGAKTGVPSSLKAGTPERAAVYWGMPATTYHDAARQYLAMAKLPEMMKEFRAMKAKLDSLSSEKPTNPPSSNKD